MFDPRLRYHGSVVAAPSLGDPRVVGLLGIVAIAFIVGVLAGVIDLSAIGVGAVAFGGLTAVDLREQAFAKFKEASDLQDADGSVKAEDEDRFNALVDEGKSLDDQAGKASKTEGNSSTIQERLSEYNQRAGKGPMIFDRIPLDARRNVSIGTQFIGSPVYKTLVESGVLETQKSVIQSNPVIFTGSGLGRFDAAASDVVHTEGDTPTFAAPATRRLAGVKEFGRPELTVRNLFPNESETADSIEYVAQVSQDRASGMMVKQSTAVNDAAGLKPQSSAGTEVRTAHAETVATWVATTRRALRQPQAIRSFIDNQLRLFLALEEEAQLVNGDGTRPNISGLLDQDDRLALDISALGGLDNLDALRVAKRLVRTGLSRLPADWVILNPIDSEGYDLLKNEIGDYRGGSPIGGGFGDDALPIWRLRRAESEEIAAGTALVGSSAAATVFQIEPPSIVVSNQHSDFFVRNLVAILAEEMLAFPIYFPTALCEVSLEDWPHGS